MEVLRFEVTRFEVTRLRNIGCQGGFETLRLFRFFCEPDFSVCVSASTIPKRLLYEFWEDIMGASHGDFVKYPRTPHLFGSRGTTDDKHLGETESRQFITDESLIVEEKLDGTNVGIHFGDNGRLRLQCRGHLVTEGMHAQYDLFKQWAQVKRPVLEALLGPRYILFGEWLYAKHCIHYQQLSHYFFEFDMFDKQTQSFLTWKQRSERLAGTGIPTVPILHRGAIAKSDLFELISTSQFGGRFEHPVTRRIDDRMEGLYLRIENSAQVIARAKVVRPEFVEKIKQSTHWQHQVMIVNQLAQDADIWS